MQSSSSKSVTWNMKPCHPSILSACGWTDLESYISLSCHAMATPKRCVMAVIAVVDCNIRSALVSEIRNTISGCTWSKPTHNSTKSSSWKESWENGVPLPWVANKIHMQFVNSCSLPRVGSHATEVVTVDVVDIRGWERMGKSMFAGQR